MMMLLWFLSIGFIQLHIIVPCFIVSKHSTSCFWLTSFQPGIQMYYKRGFLEGIEHHLRKMILKLFILVVLATVAAGYGYSSSSSEEHHHRRSQKPKCEKLEHFGTLTKPRGPGTFINRPAEISHFKKDGDWHTRITCPNDSQKYLLFAQETDAITKIRSKEYKNATLLAAGFNIGFIANCDDDKTMAITTSMRTIHIHRVACVSYDQFNGSL